MANLLPWMPLIVDDWISSPTRLRMTPLQRSIYLDLLAFQWKDGYLPTDANSLASMAAVSVDDFSRSWPAVSRHFSLDHGRYRNRKLALLRKAALEKLSATAEKTRKMREAKSHRIRDVALTKEPCKAIRASDSLCVSSEVLKVSTPPEVLGFGSQPEKTFYPVKILTAGNGNGRYDPVPGCEWFAGPDGQPKLGAYPRIGSQKAVYQAWISMVESQATEDRIREVLRVDGPFFGSQDWADGKITDGAKWLYGSMWDGKLPPMRSRAEREGFQNRVALDRAMDRRFAGK